MIEINELMIGNWLYCDLTKSDITWQLGNYPEVWKDRDYLNYFHPIPITEEWLTKFGFENDGYDGKIYTVKIKNRYGFCWNGSIINYSNYNMGVISKSSIDISFVHQLQNLYFALTGEELTLNA